MTAPGADRTCCGGRQSLCKPHRQPLLVLKARFLAAAHVEGADVARRNGDLQRQLHLLNHLRGGLAAAVATPRRNPCCPCSLWCRSSSALRRGSRRRCPPAVAAWMWRRLAAITALGKANGCHVRVVAPERPPPVAAAPRIGAAPPHIVTEPPLGAGAERPAPLGVQGHGQTEATCSTARRESILARTQPAVMWEQGAELADAGTHLTAPRDSGPRSPCWPR
jgi:hypothetical protein